MHVTPYSRTLHHYETDADGVCHFSNYFRILEEAFEDALSQLSLPAAGLPHGFAVVQTDAVYITPIRAGAAFHVLLSFQTVRRSFIVVHALIRDAPGTYARLAAKIAAVDRATNTAVALSPSVRETLSQLSELP